MFNFADADAWVGLVLGMLLLVKTKELLHRQMCRIKE